MKRKRKKLNILLFYPLVLAFIALCELVFALCYSGGGLLRLETIDTAPLAEPALADASDAPAAPEIVQGQAPAEPQSDAAEPEGASQPDGESGAAPARTAPAPTPTPAPVNVSTAGRLEPFRDNGLWGYKNSKGEIAIPAQFADALPFYDNDVTFAAVKQEGEIRYGLLNRSGGFLVQPIWDQVQPMSEGRGAVELEEKWAFIDEKGNFLTDYLFRECGNFHNARAKVRERSTFGYIDLDGDLACPYQWSEAGDFANDMAFVTLEQDGKIKHCVINKIGTVITSLRSMQGTGYSEGFAAVRDGEVCSYLNTKRNHAFKETFEDAKNFSGSLAAVQKGGLWGYINTRGMMVIEPQFRQAGEFVDERAPVQDEETGKWGYIDRKGQPITAFEYDEAQPFRCSFALARKGGSWGLVGTNGSFVWLYNE